MLSKYVRSRTQTYLPIDAKLVNCKAIGPASHTELPARAGHSFSIVNSVLAHKRKHCDQRADAPSQLALETFNQSLFLIGIINVPLNYHICF